MKKISFKALALSAAAIAATVLNSCSGNNNAGKAKYNGDPDSWDIVIVGGGGAGLAAAAQAAQDGNTVIVIEKEAELGGNTVISGGSYQSVTPYLVWEKNRRDEQVGKGLDNRMYKKVLSQNGCIETLRMIQNWSEEPFDTEYYKTHEFVAGDVEELSKHGVHSEYLPVLKELKQEIAEYLEWADSRMAQGKKETELALFSTLNLHIFQTYYGGLRPSSDGTEWCYGDAELVKQFVEEGQDLRPWLTGLGVEFVESQHLIVGALWYRSNKMPGAKVVIDGKEQYIEGNKGIYVMAPYAAVVNANEHNLILTNTMAKDLIIADGRITGVNIETADGTTKAVKANKGVIIATGGYAANIQKVIETNRYWNPAYISANTKSTNPSSLQGEGIEMAQNVGADVTGMGWTQFMPLSFAINGNIAFGAVDVAVFVSAKDGKRFIDESSERDVLSLSEFKDGMTFKGANGMCFYIAGEHANNGMMGPILTDFENGQYTITIDELPALLKKLGIETDAQQIINTIRESDKAVLEGTEPTDGVARKFASTTIGVSQKNEDGTYDKSSYNLDNSRFLFRILAPATHHTMGGLRINKSRQVLDTAGNPIPGLYAAGEVTGGIHGGNRLGGNALTEILVSGRIAAREAGK